MENNIVSSDRLCVITSRNHNLHNAKEEFKKKKKFQTILEYMFTSIFTITNIRNINNNKEFERKRLEDEISVWIIKILNCLKLVKNFLFVSTI